MNEKKIKYMPKGYEYRLIYDIIGSTDTMQSFGFS